RVHRCTAAAHPGYQASRVDAWHASNASNPTFCTWATWPQWVARADDCPSLSHTTACNGVPAEPGGRLVGIPVEQENRRSLVQSNGPCVGSGGRGPAGFEP